MNYLDIVARLILLGGWVLIGFWIWSILRETGRPCVTCGAELSEFDLANCFKCLGGSNA